jgi:hypothetical protein
MLKNKKMFKKAKFAPNYTHKVLTQSINPQANFASAKFAPKYKLHTQST